MTTSLTDAPTCPFCEQPEQVELFEVWPSHEFMLACCCEAMHETVVREMRTIRFGRAACCGGLASNHWSDIVSDASRTMDAPACCWIGSWSCAT